MDTLIFQLEIEFPDQLPTGLGPAWQELRTQIAPVIWNWVALQVSGIAGEDDAPPVSRTSQGFIVGPFELPDEAAVELLADIVSDAYDLFASDIGEHVVLRQMSGSQIDPRGSREITF